MSLDQIMIGLLGPLAVFVSQDKDPRRSRYACLIGMACQPAWFYMTIAAGQWGAFAASLVYTVAWARGIWNHWVKPRLGK